MCAVRAEELPILIVDDDQAFLRTLADTLALYGYQTVTAGNGRAGLELATHAHPAPAVALVDLRLPDMDGLELAGRLHQISQLTQVVVLTGHATVTSAVQALREASFDYLVKPVPPDELVRTIQNAGERWHRRAAEEELRRTSEWSHRLLENLSELIVIVDGEATITYESPSVEQILGFRPADRLGRPIAEHLDPDQHAEARAWFAGVLRGEAPPSTRFRVRGADGQYRLLEVLARNLLANPVVAGIVLTARDVTEREALERQLSHAQRLDTIGRLAGGIAHDFNNLLQAIFGAVEMASLRQNPVDIQRDLRLIADSAHRAAQLTRQLLLFSRPDPPHPQPVDITQVVMGVEHLLHRLLGEDVRLRVALPSALPAVRIDPGQLEQVLVNLAVNARDAMPHGGDLTITARRIVVTAENRTRYGNLPPAEYLDLAIRDTGEGMTEAVRARLFEPFFTTKGPGRGNGLGLATSYAIVRKASGQITVDSEPNIGTTFHLLLPLTGDAVPQAAPTGVATSPAPSAGTILVVEDDVTVRHTTALLLSRLGYAVLEAGTLQEAEALAQATPDLALVLSDLVMPDVYGMEVTERIRRLRPAVRVLYMSGFTEHPVLGTRPLDGTVLPKPFTGDQLAAAIRAALDPTA